MAPTAPIGRLLWLVLAYACVALALVGVVVPVLPTTPFAILAAYAAARGSDRLHAWLVRHRALGPLIRDWQEHRAVSRRAKRVAAATMTLSAVLVVVLAPSRWVAAATVVLLASVGSWVWLRPEPPVAE